MPSQSYAALIKFMSSISVFKESDMDDLVNKFDLLLEYIVFIEMPRLNRATFIRF